MRSTSRHYTRAGFKMSVALTQGDRRPSMEDEYLAHHFKQEGYLYYVFGVFDGHGGRQMVDHVTTNFLATLKQELIRHSRVRLALIETFRRLNDLKANDESGTTASVLLFRQPQEGDAKSQEAWIANVGDSTVYGVYEDRTYKLSVDHKPENKHEQRRLAKNLDFKEIDAKGYIIPNNDAGGLAVSRALGDSSFGPMISYQPNVRVLKRPYEAFILASDGVWDVMRSSDLWKRRCNLEGSWRSHAPQLLNQRNADFKQHDNSTLILLYR